MKPILFNSEMVRAVLDGRKTQTRRIIKPQPRYEKGYWSYEYEKGCHHYIGDTHPTEHWSLENMLPYCPYGKVGDKLWVRETFKISNRPHGDDGHYRMVYMADKVWVEIDYSEIDMGRLKPGKKYPSIFMPRWASRITLEITNIRVERVQEINRKDAKAEGVSGKFCNHGHSDVCTAGCRVGPKYNFIRLWDSINAKRGYGWDKNPWGWVIEFRRIDR